MFNWLCGFNEGLTFYLRSVPFKKYKAQVDTWMLTEVEKNHFWASAELPEAPLVLVIGTDKAAKSVVTKSH